MTDYSPEQLTALHAEGDVLVSAAAGSGKTRVLVGRIVRAAVEQGIRLDRIVAVTFTRKAAEEIRARVAQELIDGGHMEQLALLEEAPFGTIDSLCSRFVRRYAHAAGVDPAFRQLEPAEIARAQSQALDDALETVASTPASLRIRARYEDAAFRSLVLTAHARAAQRIDGQVRFSADVLPEDAALLDLVLAAYTEAFTAAKVRAGGLDFTDVKRAMLRLTHDPAVVTDIRTQVQRLLVDEFQDTDETQCAILDAVGGSELFCVGDAWQSIYRFRGADVAIFQARAEQRDPIRMADNYRSDPAVLRVVDRTFSRLFEGGYDGVVAKRAAHEPVHSRMLAELPAAQRPRTTGGVDVVIIEGDKDEARSREAAVVAARVAALIASGAARARDVALLTLYESHVQSFEDALDAVGVRSVRASSKGFAWQEQVDDALTLLRWVAAGTDDVAALGVLASPLVGMHPEQLYAVRTAARKGPLIDALRALDDARGRRALALREAVLAAYDEGGLVAAVDEAVHGVGHHISVLARRPDGDRRYANLRKLIELAHTAWGSGVRELAAFVDSIRNDAKLGEANVAADDADAVRIMTVHKAKGLEFPHVFVCDLANKGRQGADRLLVSSDGFAHFRTVDGLGRGMEYPDGYAELHAADRAAADAERRRLLYVAMTRAEVTLTISGTAARKRNGELSLQQSLGWLIPALGIDPASGLMVIPEPDLTAEVLAPDATIVAVEVTREPDHVAQLAEPVELSPLVSEAPRWTPTRADALPGWHDIVAPGDESGRDRGTLLHRALAATLMGHPIVTLEAPDAALLELVTASDTFSELARREARAELPVLVVRDAQAPTELRMDAVVRSADEWWIVDYKSTLPLDELDAWRLHGEQMRGYAAAARAAGAATVRITVLPLDRPDEPVEWIDPDLADPTRQPATLF